MSDSPPSETEVTQDIVAPAGDTSTARPPPTDVAEVDQKATGGSPPDPPVSAAIASPALVEKEETQEDIR